MGAGGLSKLPFAQTRLGGKAGDLSVGVSGHGGMLDFRTDEDRITSFTGAVDLKLALDKITVSGEDFYAENVSTLFSGIKATIADDVITERKGVGGWGQVSLQAPDALTVNVGGGPADNVVCDGNGFRTIVFLFLF